MCLYNPPVDPGAHHLGSTSKQAREHASKPHPHRADAIQRGPDVQVEHGVALVVGRGRVVVDDVSDFRGGSGRIRRDRSVDDPVVTIKGGFGAA